MRKFLSFLALFVMAFALPHKAVAWDFDGNSDPNAITIEFIQGSTPASMPLKYDGTNPDYKWSGEFKAGKAYENFRVVVDGTRYGDNTGITSLGTWVSWQLAGNGTNYIANGTLTAGKTYRFEVKGSSSNAMNMRVVEVVNNLYIYKAESTPSKWASATYSEGLFTFELDMKAEEAFVLSINDNATNWAGIKANNGRFNPSTAKDEYIPITDCAFSYGENGAWKAKDAGKYKITVDWSKQTLTAEKAIDVVWRLDGNTSPDKVIVHGTEGTTGDFVMDWNDAAATNCWSTKFIAQKQNANFTIELFKGAEIDEIYGQNVTVAAGNMSDELTLDRSAQGGTYKLSGLKIGKKYRLKLMGTGDNKFKYTVEEVPGDNILYLYKMLSATDVEQIGEGVAVGEDGKCTFVTTLTAGQNIVLSRNEGARTATGIQIYNGRYTPVTSASIPCTKSVFKNSNSGAWKVNVTDNYTITVDWTAKTLTAIGESNLPDAPANLYLYKISDDNSVFEMIGGSPCNGNIYTYTVDIETGMKVVLSSISDATNWDGINGQVDGKYVRYNPAAEINIPGNDIAFDLNEQTGAYKDGIWRTTQEGRYTITVTWGETKTLTAICTYVPPTGTHMPLNSADFANGKKHYFLVGERMGEWHLQPEWEFQEKDGSLVLEGRYIYNGGFAVGVVDNFKDYVNHTFTYYSQSAEINSEDAITLPSTGATFAQAAGSTRFNPATCYKSTFDTTHSDPYWHGRGVFMSKIELTLNGEQPATLKFTKGSTEEANKNRVFTLCGDNIYNRNYCNTNESNPGKTTMYNRGFADNMNGWQEGWIQYDPTTNKPYVDARGEYLYHTSFTPDYLMAHPVLFNQIVGSSRESEFAYTSNNVQFVEWKNLPNLESDPYKDFYQAFTGTKTISNSSETVSGNGYDFKLGVECDNPTTTPEAGWDCYVVRDMWIAGHIKFWTGWGGNTRKTGGVTEDGAVWHGPNGGPDTPQIDNGGTEATYQVKGYDVNSGLRAVLYKNVRNRNNTNYAVTEPNAKPVYFNRVVLWFNNTDGVDKSYIQFIQESVGPAIFAKVTNNGKEGKENKDNYITYNWYLNASQNNGAEDEYDVISYEIRRYRVVDNVTTPIGYPEGEKVDISDKNLKVKDFYEGSATLPEFTTHVDTGEVAGRGFAPGRYQYDIYVTYKKENGESVRKYAMSNRVAIYDDALVTPDAVAMQVIELRDYYKDFYGTEHASGKETLGTTKKYLTYRTNDNANFYVFDTEEKEITVGGTKVKTTVPKDPEIIDAKKAIEFIQKNPDKFWWTSDYYLRCLDYDDYARRLQGYIDEGLMKNEEVPTPILHVDEIYNYTNESGEAQSLTKTRGYGQRFEFGDQTYYAMIVKRGGNLSNATFEVQLRYTYVDVNDESQTPETKATVGISPVMPRPFAPLYRYVYDRTSAIPTNAETGNAYEWGKILVPTQNWKTNDTSDAIKKDLLKEAYVKFDDNFKPRTFTLQVDFYRPNVNEEIYKFYDIQYNIKVTNNDETVTSVPLDMDAVLHDVDTSDENFPNRYRLEFRGMHPRNGVYPTVKFERTYYVPNEAAGTFQEPYLSKTGNYGDMLTIDAKRNLTVNRGTGIKDVHLGYIKRSDGTYDWMYKGHKELDDEPEIVDPTRPDENGKNEYEDQGSVEVQPIYYLIELKNPKNDSDCKYYPFLVPHIDNHREGDALANPEFDKNGLIMYDKDPLIGTYIATDTNWDETNTPDVVATAIYMFERPISGEQGNYSGYNFNRLEVISIKHNNTGEVVTPTPTPDTEAAAARANAAKLPSTDDLVHGNAGGLPDADNLPTANVLDMSDKNNTTGYNAYVAVRGAHYVDGNTGENVTGVEDVLADGENGEAVYYNMQGMRIDEPTTAGVYFRVVGKNVTKFVVK